MTRKTFVLLAAMLAMLLGLVMSAGPAGATRARDIDPSLLALPTSALPAGAVIDDQMVADNATADKSQLHVVHQNLYEALHRITGYQMDFRYKIQGVAAGTEYLASVFGSQADAQAAMKDAIAPGTLIALIGQPLPQQCTVGDLCQAYSGPNPGTPNMVILAIFTDGPIMVETASGVPSVSFAAVEPALQATLYALLAAADVQIKLALSGGGKITDTPTAVSTDTQVPATPTATPKPLIKKKHCKKGTHLVHGKCKKKKKKH
jgi:hypothetical protein